MDRTEFFQAPTLFLVAAINIQTNPGGHDTIGSTIVETVALLLFFLLPLYIIAQIIRTWTSVFAPD